MSRDSSLPWQSQASRVNSSPMMERFQHIYADRAWRSIREIVIAVVLTLAAVVFLLAALTHRANETASVTPPSAVERPAAN